MANPYWLRFVLKVAAVAAPLAAVALVGCEREQEAGTQPTGQAKTSTGRKAPRATQPGAPTTAEAVAAADGQSAELVPDAPPYLMLDEQPMPGQRAEPLRGPAQFPTGTLRISKDGDVLTAVLYSNDPPEARRKGYHGNSFLFNPPPEVAAAGEVAELLDEGWYYKSASSEAEDTPNGIFLDGLRTQLQPADVMIRFEGAPPKMTAHVMGQFRKFTAGGSDALSSVVVVTGSVPVVVEVDE